MEHDVYTIKLETIKRLMLKEFEEFYDAFFQMRYKCAEFSNVIEYFMYNARSVREEIEEIDLIQHAEDFTNKHFRMNLQDWIDSLGN